MRPFELLEPKNLAEACNLLDEYREEAKVIAGGQSLLPMLRSRLIASHYVINIKGLSELDYIQEGPGGIMIGTLVTHRAVEDSPLIKLRFPMLVEMERQLASIQIRNWGTLGGNLCHADPAGDPAPCLIALGAKLKVKSVRREREIPLGEFFVDYLESVLEPNEILMEIGIPNHPPNTGGAFIKESVTTGSIAIVSVGAVVTIDGEVVKDARIVLGAMGPTPIRVRDAERALVERRPLEEVAMIAADEARPSADVGGSVEFKRNLVKVVTRSAVLEAMRRAKKWHT